MAFGEQLDRRRFDALVVEHVPSALRFAIRLTGNLHAGEDLMHDALLRAFRSWRSFRGESKFTTWLFQIIINVFRDRTSNLRLVEEIETEADIALDLEAKELGEIVANHVSNLPPRQREVLVLIAYENLSITETAGVLGISEQNVRTTLHLARNRMREKLASYLSENIRE